MTYSTYEHAGFQLRYADIEEACYRLWSIKDVQDNCSFKPENGSYSNFIVRVFLQVADYKSRL